MYINSAWIKKSTENYPPAAWTYALYVFPDTDPDFDVSAVTRVW